MAVGSTAMLVIAAGAMLATDLVLALVGFVVFPLLAIANLVFQRRVSPAATHAQALRSQVSEVAHESFDGALVVKTLGREDMETERFTRAAERLRDAQIRVGRMRAAFDPLLEALPNLGVLVVLLIGLIRLQRGDVTAGDIVQIAYLFTLLSLPIRSLGWLLGDLPRSVVGWRRVSAVLNAQGGTDYGKERLHGEGGLAVSVRNLSFSYADTSPADLGRDTLEGGRGLDATGNEETPRITVLRDVTLDLAPGKVTALVGPTGSGKSTLTMLLARLVDPDHGDVLVNGVDARRYAPGELARAIALVPQTTFIFDDTVRDNITLGLDVDDTEVWQALRLAHADSFVAALPRGLDTRLGERGTSLSGGQRQRLALARSLVRRPRLLILDDATSAVDPQVEARILGGLREADLAGATVVVVAYRRATIELADEVVYLEQGTVRDRGTHEELLARSPDTAVSSPPTSRLPNGALRRVPIRRPGGCPMSAPTRTRTSPPRPRGGFHACAHRARPAPVYRVSVGHFAPRGRPVPRIHSRPAGDRGPRRGGDPRQGDRAARRPADHRQRAARRRRTRHRLRGGHGRALHSPGRRHRAVLLPDERALYQSTESGLATLRRTAFRHVHDLSVLTQNSERKGALVSRVTSDVDQISTFMQWGGILLIVSTGQLAIATVLMAVYSWQLTLLVWVCFLPLLRGALAAAAALQAYLKVRERTGRCSASSGRPWWAPR